VILNIAGREVPNLQFSDPLMGSGKPAGVPKARQAKKETAAGGAQDRRPRNKYRSLIPSWDREGLSGLLEAPQAVPIAAGDLIDRQPHFAHMALAPLRRGEEGGKNRECHISDLSKEKFCIVFPHKTNKLLNFHISIYDTMQVPCSCSGD
jgi:hypothetical protein